VLKIIDMAMARMYDVLDDFGLLKPVLAELCPAL
jgi:hypothetical protein